MVTKYVWPLASSALVVLFGAALLIWPFAVHTNVGGWTHATTTDFWSGVGTIVIGLLMFLGWYGGLKHELVQRGIVEVRRVEEPPTPPAAVAAPSEDLDRLLRPLAESVLRDLTEQLAAKEGRSGGGSI
ncbi:MAG: hypothetical protein M1272_07225 [Firmicutes bacterium]|nr:hypothetical protein [Bacillota bacterium]